MRFREPKACRVQEQRARLAVCRRQRHAYAHVRERSSTLRSVINSAHNDLKILWPNCLRNSLLLLAERGDITA